MFCALGEERKPTAATLGASAAATAIVKVSGVESPSASVAVQVYVAAGATARAVGVPVIWRVARLKVKPSGIVAGASA